MYKIERSYKIRNKENSITSIWAWDPHMELKVQLHGTHVKYTWVLIPILKSRYIVL